MLLDSTSVSNINISLLVGDISTLQDHMLDLNMLVHHVLDLNMLLDHVWIVICYWILQPR
jgi:hypothetical protein